MGTFISTIKFTEKGIQGIQETTKRAAEFEIAAKKLGMKVAGIYWTLGPFDGIIIFDASNDAAAAAAMLHLSSKGNVHTATTRAFDSTEMEKIVDIASRE